MPGQTLPLTPVQAALAATLPMSQAVTAAG